MSETRKRTRSVSGEMESDGEYDEDSHILAEEAGRPGRKRKSNSQAARRDQNRIAQREFRLRKQQRIRDLEARVELLSGNKDETYVQMRDIIRELISENYTLRTLVRNLSNFIGDGAGGVLPSLGWSLEEFDAFIKKADTDTAFEAFMKHRNVKSAIVNSHLLNDVEQDQNRTQQTSSSSTSNHTISERRKQTDNSPDNLLNYPTVGNPSGFASSSAAFSPQTLSILSAIRPSYNSEFVNGVHSHDSSSANSFPSIPFDFTSAPSVPVSIPSPPSLRITTSRKSVSSFPTPTPSSSHHVSDTISSVTFPSPDDADSIANYAFGAQAVRDACKLISYHLENFRRNSAYCLPLSLRPTLVQRTVEHDRIIDGVPHPEIRDRMILFKDRFDLIDCVQKYLKCIDIHGDDVLDHTNWEIRDIWLKEFGFLVDPSTLGIVNRWRKEQKEREITMAETCPSGHI